MTVGSLFAGIGGFDLGFEREGFEVRWQVEKDEFCRKVLAKHWPDVKRYEDIRDVGAHNLEPVNIICGGFPCQPFSAAGKRLGTADDRDLWPEMYRVIQEIEPSWVVAENVYPLTSIQQGLVFERMLSDLEDEGYEVGSFGIPACAVDAKHIRMRIWIMAYSNNKRQSQPEGDEHKKRRWVVNSNKAMAYASSARLEGHRNGTSRTEQEYTAISSTRRWEPEPELGRVAHGIPHRMDRIKSLGNAVVPQLIQITARIIMEVESVRKAV